MFEDDPELLRRFRHGERDALEAVYRHYVTDVLRFLRAGFTTGAGGTPVAGLPEAAAMELAQEVFVKAFSESARLGFDGLRPYRPYVLRIAHNARIDQLRRSGREVLMADPPAELESAAFEAPEASGVGALEWEAQQTATRSYVSGLDSEQQRFVALRFVEELSQEDVAQRMSITRRRVRTLERQVLRGLRKALAQRGFR